VLAVPLFFPKGAHKLTVLPGLSLLKFKKDFSEVRFIPGFTPGLHRPWLAEKIHFRITLFITECPVYG
jgi:hypothetical protein